MANKKQRLKNRQTSKALRQHVKDQHLCENCGKHGAHWHQMPMSMTEIMRGEQPHGFYSCQKFERPTEGPV